MRVREGLLLLVGCVLGAGFALLAAGNRSEEAPYASVPQTLRPSVAPARPVLPAPGPTSPVPAVEASAEEPKGNLELRTLSLQLEVQRILLARAGAPRAPAGSGLPPHPYAAKTPEELEEMRAKADGVVQPLLARWRQAAPGEERAAAMKELSMPMLRLLEAGGSMDHLLTLEESAERGETPDERRWAVIATHTLWHPPVVDYQLARARSPHVEVRFYAVEGLAWVRGDEKARAVDGVVRALEDVDPGVREIAALSLGAIVADPARAEAVLARLGRETDPVAARAMAAAVLRLDPAGGKARVRSALETVPADVRAAVEKALAAR